MSADAANKGHSKVPSGKTDAAPGKRSAERNGFDHVGISNEMRAIILDEVSTAGGRTPLRVVFQGGNALALAYGNPRPSQDLDFIVSEEEDGLEAVMHAVRQRLRDHFERAMPGSVAELAHDVSPDGRLERWNVRWVPSNRRGKVLVRAEFWRTSPELFDRYAASMRGVTMPSAIGEVTERDLLTAGLQSLWSDKVMALANRPTIKLNDVLDLAFIADRLSRGGSLRSDAEVVDGLRVSAGIYDRGLLFVYDRLRPLLSERGLVGVDAPDGADVSGNTGRSILAVTEGTDTRPLEVMREIYRAVKALEPHVPALGRAPGDGPEYYERILRELPDAFRPRDLADLHGIERGSVEAYLDLWRRLDYVQLVDLDDGICVNSYRVPSRRRLARALEGVLGGPLIVIGAASLFQHNWIAGRPSFYEVAVPGRPTAESLPMLRGMKLIPRDEVWFERVQGHYAEGLDDIKALSPAFALIDGLTSQPLTEHCSLVWRPSPEDISPPGDMTPEEFREAVLLAAEALGADREAVEGYLSKVVIAPAPAP